jgi:ElaB/YqjD/DUF883 family membrane-anchored ribosome-binding protein
MAETELPEGTDSIVAGAAETTSEKELIVKEPTARNKVVDTVRAGSDKLSGQAADKARDLVGQGLTRSSEAIGNVSKLIGDTADGLDERLGTDVGDYARKAASSLEDVANKLATKDADELIDDTRAFVKKSPGVALGIAAVAGFALVRLVKSGLDAGRDDD